MSRKASEYDTDFVLDVAEQRLIAFYNENQVLLRDRMRRDPDFTSKLRGRARHLESTTRAWLAVVDSKPPDRVEAMFRFWCSRLEPAEPISKITPEREKELRAVYIKHCTERNWQENGKPWVEAIKRVRRDQTVKLNIPAIAEPEDEEEDEYL